MDVEERPATAATITADRRPGAILALILGREHLQQFFVLGIIALWVALITALVSGIDYYRKFNHLLSQR